MLLSYAVAAGWAHAADPAAPSEPAAPPVAPAPAVDIPALEARIAALEAALQQQQQAALLAEAEALAAAPTPAEPQSAARAAVNAFNPGITAFGDMVAQSGVIGGELAPGSTVYLRSLELQLRADVDPFAKADAVIAFEQEAPPLDGGPGEGFGAEPEEVYIDLVAMPGGFSARVGKFKIPFGLINRIHPHDLPWTDAPEALDLLGDEGYNDTGVSVSRLVSLGSSALTLTAAGLAGEPFDPDGERLNLAALARAELFTTVGRTDISLGASDLADAGGGQAVLGADLSVRWRASQHRSLFVMAEGFRGVGGGLGGYAAAQVQPKRNLYVGFREDFSEAGLKHSLYLSGYTSEFLRLRVGGGYDQSSGDLSALGQLTFVWGSHPVEPWWVNK